MPQWRKKFDLRVHFNLVTTKEIAKQNKKNKIKHKTPASDIFFMILRFLQVLIFTLRKCQPKTSSYEQFYRESWIFSDIIVSQEETMNCLNFLKGNFRDDTSFVSRKNRLKNCKNFVKATRHVSCSHEIICKVRRRIPCYSNFR